MGEIMVTKLYLVETNDKQHPLIVGIFTSINKANMCMMKLKKKPKVIIRELVLDHIYRGEINERN